MPLEIRELIIKATIEDTSDNNNNTSSPKAKEVDVNLIVDKVLTILREKAER